MAKQTKKAVLVATHDLEPALQTADKVWLLNQHTLVQEIPEMLALKGDIATAFGHQGLQYDARHDKFVLAYQATHFVQLMGEGLAYQQTEKALYRIGYHVQDSADIKLMIQNKKDGFVWVWEGVDNFHTLESLLEALERLTIND